MTTSYARGGGGSPDYEENLPVLVQSALKQNETCIFAMHVIKITHLASSDNNTQSVTVGDYSISPLSSPEQGHNNSLLKRKKKLLSKRIGAHLNKSGGNISVTGSADMSGLIDGKGGAKRKNKNRIIAISEIQNTTPKQSIRIHKLSVSSNRTKVAIMRTWWLSELIKLDGRGQTAEQGLEFSMTFGDKIYSWRTYRSSDRAEFLWTLLQYSATKIGRAPPVQGLRILDLQQYAESVSTRDYSATKNNKSTCGISDLHSANRNTRAAEIEKNLKEPEKRDRAHVIETLEQNRMVDQLSDPRNDKPRDTPAPKGNVEINYDDIDDDEPVAFLPEALAGTGLAQNLQLTDTEIADLEYLFEEWDFSRIIQDGSFTEFLSNSIRQLEKENINEIINSEDEAIKVEAALNIMSTSLVNAESWLDDCIAQLKPCRSAVISLELLLLGLEKELENTKKLYDTVDSILNAVSLSKREEQAIKSILGTNGATLIDDDKFVRETFYPAVESFSKKLHFSLSCAEMSEMSAIQTGKKALVGINERIVQKISGEILIKTKDLVENITMQQESKRINKHLMVYSVLIYSLYSLSFEAGEEVVSLYQTEASKKMSAEYEEIKKQVITVEGTAIRDIVKEFMTHLRILCTRESIIVHRAFGKLMEIRSLQRHMVIKNMLLSQFKGLDVILKQYILDLCKDKNKIEGTAKLFGAVIELLTSQIFSGQIDEAIYKLFPDLDEVELSYYAVLEFLDDIIQQTVESLRTEFSNQVQGIMQSVARNVVKTQNAIKKDGNSSKDSTLLTSISIILGLCESVVKEIPGEIFLAKNPNMETALTLQPTMEASKFSKFLEFAQSAITHCKSLCEQIVSIAMKHVERTVSKATPIYAEMMKFEFFDLISKVFEDIDSKLGTDINAVVAKKGRLSSYLRYIERLFHNNFQSLLEASSLSTDVAPAQISKIVQDYGGAQQLVQNMYKTLQGHMSSSQLLDEIWQGVKEFTEQKLDELIHLMNEKKLRDEIKNVEKLKKNLIFEMSRLPKTADIVTPTNSL